MARANEWMSAVPGNLLLTQLSIPGTHDSCCRRETITDWKIGADFASCQYDGYDVPRQLEIGVRYLDFRMEHAARLVHGIAKLSGHFFDEINCCVQFLQSHPSECVLVSSQWESEDWPGGKHDEPEEEVKWIVKELKLRFGIDRFWFARRTPTLDEARGKVVFLSRWHYETDKEKPDGIRYNPQSPTSEDLAAVPPFRCQDKYDQTDNMHNYPPIDKWNNYVEPFLRKAMNTKETDAHVWHFCFCNAYAGAPPGRYVSPRDMAWVGGGGVNNRLEEALNGEHGPLRLGIVIVDFIHENLARIIYNKNPRVSGNW